MIDQFNNAFDVYDKDKDGFLTTQDLSSIFKYMGQTILESDLQDMINEVDTNGDGNISKQEFVNYMVSKMKENDSDEEIQQAIEYISQEKDDTIKKLDLLKLTEEMNEALEQEDIDFMMQILDQDKKGYLSHNDISNFLLKKQIN